MRRPSLRLKWLVFLLFLCSLLALAASAFIIEQTLDNEEDALLANLYNRAQSLAWSIEGAGRFLEARQESRLLSSLLLEIGRQPGIAWVALVAPDGRILQDSNPELAGAILYTPAEMLALQPGSTLQGRFSPDDYSIFETWKLYAPERLWPNRHKKNAPGQRILFIALDASNLHATILERRQSLWLLALSFISALVAGIALAYYLRRYQQSHRGLEDAKALAQQVISNFPGGLIVISEDGAPVLYNEKARQYFPAEGASATLAAIDWPVFQKEMANGVMLEKEVALPPDGRPVGLSGAAMTDGRGRPSGYLLILQDLSEMRLLKRKLAESQRLSSLGQLASGLAHEIRNPLSSICGYACYLGKRLANDPMGKATAALLEEEASRLNNILTDLLHLARPPELKPQSTSLAPILARLSAIVQPDAEAKKIGLSEICHDGPNIQADPDRLLQALLNITLNAIQATPPGGNVDISASWLDPHRAKEIVDLKTGVWEIEIADTGPGINAAMREKIFTPYFTTRANGTGLGLPLARQIIEAHNGTIAITSLPGKGATFKIYLPAEPQ